MLCMGRGGLPGADRIGTNRCRVPRPVLFRGTEQGMHAPGPRRNDGFHALSHPPSTEGINIIGRVAFRQNRGSSVQASTAPRLSAVVAQAARHAQGGPRLRPRAGSASFWARVRPCCPAVWQTDPDQSAYRPSGAASRPGCIRRPSGDHFPFPVRGRQLQQKQCAICVYNRL